ncbi:MAG TPA: ABC transporter permease [Bryobacteraceae bacterium]|nr:ABC transporter permease [Bryobacteraceae bacterium]
MGQLEQFVRNCRYASRSLRKSPAFAAAAILTLALGIGANTAIFSVLEGVVLAPLPYHEPDRLVLVALYNRTLGYATNLSYPDFLNWQQSSGSLEQIAAFKGRGFDLSSPGAPEHVDGKEVSSNFFSTLGVKLWLGRDLSPEEDRAGGMPAVVISHRLWQDHFEGSPATLGKAITLDGVDFTIVGILRPGFRFGDQQADVYTTLGRTDPLFRSDRTVHDILCVARLQRGVSVGQAQAEMNSVQDHIVELNPSTERGLGTYIVPLKQFFIGDVGGTLLLLMGAVAFVLLIACANVANLLLARSAVRTREFAVRLALGASRAQVAQQMVTESVLLSLVGGVLGLAIAAWGLNAVLAAAPGSMPRTENIGVNTPVLLFAFGISIVVGIVFGLLPALKRSDTDLQAGLKEGGRGSAGGRQHTQRVLVVVQIALALILLTGGSLLLRTIRNLWAVNPGFDTQHIITFQVGLSPSVTTPPRVRSAYQQLVERIRQVPGVEAADITALVPLSEGRNEGPFWVGSHQPASMAEIPRAIYYPSGPDYLRTLKIPLLNGRFLTRADNINGQLVVVIDNLLARTYFPGRNAVGQTITIPHWGAARNVAARVVGVVGHVEHYGLDGSFTEKPQIYYAFYQLPDNAVPAFRGEVTLAVRTPLDAATVMPAIRNAIYEAGSDQPVYNIHTMQELVSGSMGRQRFPMLLLVAFAVLALLLASIGIYGVISYSVTERVREIGIRMALGAEKRDVLRMVVGQGLRLAVAGVAIGLVIGFILAQLLSSFTHLLYGIRAGDPLTFIAVGLGLLAAAVLACYIPARRAARLDPMVALRQE